MTSTQKQEKIKDCELAVLNRVIKRSKKMSAGLSRAGFTMLELLVSLVVFTVALVFFYTVFITNWQAYQTHIIRSNLWEECDSIVEMISLSSRDMRQIDIARDSIQQSARLLDPAGQPLATYVMNEDGEFQVISRDNDVTIISQHVDFARSSFAKVGKSLVVNLALVDRLWAQDVSIQTAAEILPRN